LGAGATYWQIIGPIFKALRGVEYIDYSRNVGVLGSFALILGVFLIVFGPDAGSFLEGKVSKPVLISVIIGVIIYAIACLFVTEFIFKSLDILKKNRLV
jgi:hypothetical protein